MEKQTTRVPDSAEKPTFARVYASTGLGYSLIDTIAELAGVPRFVINEMLLTRPVAPQDADKVLRIINQHTGKSYSRETVDIPVLPTGDNAELLKGVQDEQ